MKVTVLGAGYVGLISGVCLAEIGHDVSVLDIDPNRVAMLRDGLAPIVEDGLAEMLIKNAARLSFGMFPAELGEADVVLVAVGTPSAANGSADLSYVRSAVKVLAETMAPGTVVAMKSTVPPGTGDTLSREISAAGMHYASNPEFLREGTAIRDFFETDRIVVGAADPTVFPIFRALYEGVEAPIVECDVASAEMIKYASNAFLAVKISFINEIANLCDRVGADVELVADGVGMDARIGRSFLSAGIGYGGSCFPKDTRALDHLAAASGYDFQLLKAVIDVNTLQRGEAVRAVARDVAAAGKTLSGSTVAVLGISFKPGTDDVRESPAVDIIEMLDGAGAAVRAHDPVGTLPATCPAVQYADLYETLAGADAAILSTAWPEYAAIDWSQAATVMVPGALIFDGRNLFNPDEVRSSGLDYRAVGRPNVSGPAFTE